MSGDESSPEAEYFARLFSGEESGLPPKDERSLLDSVGNAFAIAVAALTLRENLPDPEDRRKFVDTLFVQFQFQWDQLLAKHRDMMDSDLGRMFSGSLVGADDAAERIEALAEKAREYLYYLAGIGGTAAP